LQPGDAVEVTLRYQDGPDAPVRRLSSSNIPSGIGRTDATGDASLREMASERKGATSRRWLATAAGTMAYSFWTEI